MTDNTFKLSISENALSKISSVLKDKPVGSFFRIDITSGGCSGFSTSFRIDSDISDEDIIINQNGIKVAIHKELAHLIGEAELKYNQDILSSYFNLDVKTATAKCSCGASFGL